MNYLGSISASFNSDGVDRLDFIRKLEADGGDAALAFLAQVAGSELHPDYVRVDSLKALRTWRGGALSTRRDVAATLAETIRKSHDDLVRGFAAMAMANFFGLPGVLDVLIDVVSNRKENEDVRHNALDPLEHHAENERVQELLTALAKVNDSIGSAARRILKESR